MRKINILYTIWSLNYGGAERFVLGLIERLSKQDYNIIVFSDSHQDGPMRRLFELAGAKVVSSTVHRFKHPIKYKRQLAEILRREKIDIIHANDDLNMIFPLLVKPKDTTFVAHSHNTIFRFTSNALISHLVERRIKKIIASRSDKRLSCSNEAGKALFGTRDYQVIHNGIDIARYKYSATKRKIVREKIGISRNATVLLNIGRLAKEKNQSFLIDVFLEYHKINHNSNLIIIGDGAEKKALRSKINSSGLKECVFLLGSQDNTADYYSASDFFIMPSIFEGMPLVSIEAQANGLKCVFSSSITNEVNLTGDAVFYSLDLSAKQWANNLSHISTKRSNTSYDRISEYDIHSVTKETDSFYKSLIMRSER